MLIQGTLVNLSRNQVSTEEFVKYLSVNIPTAEFFTYQPAPGRFMNASIDWRGVLYDAAAIATLAQVLWSAYTTFIKSAPSNNPNSESAILIQIKNENGEFDQLMIGKEIKDKEVLLQRIDESVKKLKTGNNVHSQEIEEIKKSGYWIHIK